MSVGAVLFFYSYLKRRKQNARTNNTDKELQQSFIQSQSIKPNATGSRECLLLPKENQLFGGADQKKHF